MEWTSLTLFTVLAEAAVGLILLYALFGWTAAAREQQASYQALGRSVLLTAWLTTGIAVLASLSHLGWPQFAFRALGGLGSSWLSWEVVLTGLFAAGALGLWLLSAKRALEGWALALLALVGLAATYASGMIYTLRSIPANAGGFPVLLFLASTLLLGGVGLLLLLGLTKAGQALAPAWLNPLILLTLGAILLTGALTLAHTGAAANGLPEARAQAALLTGSAWYAIRLLVGLLVPALLLLGLARQRKANQVALLLPALLVVAGELTGRMLFFTSSVFTGINTGF